MRELFIGTGNPGKSIEIENAFKDLPFKLVLWKDVFPNDFDVDEVGETFEGNALIKVFTFAKHARMLTLADDTGLEVDALNGDPGVRTARYAPGTDEDRYRFLLKKMEHVPDGKRGGRMRCVIAIYDAERNDKVHITNGEMRVTIAREPRGTLGFGYDPILFVEETQKMHSEETTEERNRTSHRGKALVKAREILLAEFT